MKTEENIIFERLCLDD